MREWFKTCPTAVQWLACLRHHNFDTRATFICARSVMIRKPNICIQMGICQIYMLCIANFLDFKGIKLSDSKYMICKYRFRENYQCSNRFSLGGWFCTVWGGNFWIYLHLHQRLFCIPGESNKVWYDVTKPVHKELHSDYMQPLAEIKARSKNHIQGIRHLVQNLRLIKSPAEIERMKIAGRVTSEVRSCVLSERASAFL